MEKQRCHACGHIISERRITLYRGMSQSLWQVFKWCKEHGVHEFQRKQVKHLFHSENESARFGDWVMFGGLVYKKGKGLWGLNMERCDAFFRGQYTIPMSVWKNPVTGTLRPEDYRTVDKIPTLLQFLDADLHFVALYR